MQCQRIRNLKQDCILYDDNHQPTNPLGDLGPDGNACIYRGLGIPIGPHFWHNKADTLLCNDNKLKDCFLFRTDKDSAWEPIHPMLVSGDCFAYYNGQPWMRVGTPTADKQGCEREGHVIPIGQTLKPERDEAGHYCYDEPDKMTKQTKKLWCLQPPEHPQTDARYLMRRWTGGMDRAQEDLARQGAQVRKALDESAQGVPLHATTPVKEAVAAARTEQPLAGQHLLTILASIHARFLRLPDQVDDPVPISHRSFGVTVARMAYDVAHA